MKHYLVFYSDGTFYDMGFNKDSFDTIRKQVNGKSYEKNTIGVWGCYIIKNDTLKIERFQSRFKFPYTAYWTVKEDNFVIENDSTLSIKVYVDSGSVKEEIRKIYLLNECFDCKPDSFNFIKRKLGRGLN